MIGHNYCWDGDHYHCLLLQMPFHYDEGWTYLSTQQHASYTRCFKHLKVLVYTIQLCIRCHCSQLEWHEAPTQQQMSVSSELIIFVKEPNIYKRTPTHILAATTFGTSLVECLQVLNGSKSHSSTGLSITTVFILSLHSTGP